MNRILILIPCSGSKKKGGITIYNVDDCIVNYLDPTYEGKLLNLRRELFRELSLPLGRDLCYEDEERIEYLAAYERYTGNYSQIYRRISQGSWDKLKQTPKLELIIVSALYGLLKYDEPIRWYDKTMKDKFKSQTLKTWWRNNSLCAILKNYVDKNNIYEVHNVLSDDYNEALSGCFVNMKAKYQYHGFADYKSGSNAHRGKWAEAFVQSF